MTCPNCVPSRLLDLTNFRIVSGPFSNLEECSSACCNNTTSGPTTTVGPTTTSGPNLMRSLWVWGLNNIGQLGDGSTTNRLSPTRIGSATWNHISSQPFNSGSLGIRTDGSLWGWGQNNFGQLGNGSTTTISIPTRIGSSSWTSVDIGHIHSLGILFDGSLWAWGNNNSGQLGDGSITQKLSPVKIDSGSWTRISAGVSYSLGIRSDGSLWAWGDNRFGQLGDGSTSSKSTPTRIGSSSWTSITTGTGFSLGIRSDGSLWAWGDNIFGQLGDGSTIDKRSPTRIGSSTWIAISAGGYHVLGIRSDGSLWAWGQNTYGQLGDGSNINKRTPVRIGSSTWTGISAGGYHSLAISSDGSLWAWGQNNTGRLGDGSTIDRRSPVRIGSSSWLSVSAGFYHSVGILANIQGVPPVTTTALPTTTAAPTTTQSPNPPSSILFNRSSWSSQSSGIKSIIDAGASAWEQYIRYSSQDVPLIQQAYPGWSGLRMNSIAISNYGATFLAACSINQTYNRIDQNGKQIVLPVSFDLYVNTYYYPSTQWNWSQVMIHELGHALGIGILWSAHDCANTCSQPYPPVIQPGGSLGTVSALWLNGVSGLPSYPKAQQAYNAIAPNRTKIPVEENGAEGSAGVHWEYSLRRPIASNRWPQLPNGDVEYPEIYDIMVMYITPDPVTALSVNFLLDIGFASTGVQPPALQIPSGVSIMSNREPSSPEMNFCGCGSPAFAEILSKESAKKVILNNNPNT